MKVFIVSLFFWLFVVLTSILIFPVYVFIWLLTILFDKNLRAAHYFTGIWARLYIGINPWWEFTVAGREKIDKKKVYVIVCNHQSLLDALLIFYLKRHFRWVIKIEIYRLPIAGWVMAMNKYLKVKRGDKESAAVMMQQAKKAISQGNSIMFFPEGTRSKDGNLNPFKEGAFTLALETKTNIIPVIIDGTFEVLPKNGLWLKPNRQLVLKVLDEIDISTYNETDIAELMQHTWQTIKTNLDELRNSGK